jgi:phage tail protein X
MNRYTTAKTLKTENGPRRVSTSIFPVIPMNPQTDIYIRTTSIERLDKLAYQFYEDQSWWWVIASANGLGNGTLIIPTDTRLRIPDITNVMNVLNEINKTR